jgi:outer membrane protein assembly factor BamB
MSYHPTALFRIARLLPVVCFLIAGLSNLYAGTNEWPAYMHDAERSGRTSASLPNELTHLWTDHTTGVPSPAWPTNDRQTEDRVNQPIVLQDKVIFGDSNSGRVLAFSITECRLLWTFATEGPIRFAPVAWRDRIFVASDDGYLYALDADDGDLLWKQRGGPDDRLILGNERLISKWPARGGPALVETDDRAIVYFAAGIWPSDGIYLYALDAASGDILWQNTDSGYINMPQPHGGAVAESGISAQGYLVASNDRLLVPTGRAVPAALDRNDGTFEYFHLQQFGQNGGSAAMAYGPAFFNGGGAYRLDDGQRILSIGTGPLAATENGCVRASGTTIESYDLETTMTYDRLSQPVESLAANKLWTKTFSAPCVSLITAGDHIIAGCKGSVELLDVESGEMLKSFPVEGAAYGLAATDQGLAVSTDAGAVSFFGVKTRNGSFQHRQTWRFHENAASAAETQQAQDAAKAILDRTKISDGYCVDLDCGDGWLAIQLAMQSNLHICCFSDDPQNIAAAKARIQAAGLLGSRISLYLRSPSSTGAPAMFADLVVSKSSISSSETLNISEELLTEARRLQRPYGGMICLGNPLSENAIIEERGELPDAGSWTHQYADPANTVCSGDEIVRGRLTMNWFRDIDFPTPSRHGRGPSPLYEDGLLIYEGLDGLIAVNAYNGRELWRYDIPGILKPYDGDELMGLAGTGADYCMGDGSVFVAHENRCHQLDAATGELVAEFLTPPRQNDDTAPWGYLAYQNGTLYGSLATPEHIVTYRYVDSSGDMSQLLTESSALFAYDVETSELLWRYDAKDSIRHNAIAIAGETLFLIDRPLALYDREKRPTEKEHPLGLLKALNVATGETRWAVEEEVFGTTLAVAAEQSVLLMGYQPTRFRLDSELGGRLAGFNTTSGERLWDIDAAYESRLMLIGDAVYGQGGAWNISSGEPVPFDFQRSYGCGILASGAHMLVFRSATLGYYDLSGAQQTENFGGIRPGCWINAIPAGGLVLVPDATAGCKCSYLTTAWFALAPE